MATDLDLDPDLDPDGSRDGDLGRGIFEPGSKKSAPGTGQGIFETGYGDTIFEQGHFEVLGHIFYGGRKPPWLAVKSLCDPLAGWHAVKSLCDALIKFPLGFQR